MNWSRVIDPGVGTTTFTVQYYVGPAAELEGAGQMNPDDVCVQTIARTLLAEYGLDREDLSAGEFQQAVDTARAVLFDLAKAGVRLVEPGDVVGEPVRDEEQGTVTLLLKAEA